MRRRRGGDLRRGLLYDPRVGGMGNTAPSVSHLLKLMLRYKVSLGELDRNFAD